MKKSRDKAQPKISQNGQPVNQNGNGNGHGNGNGNGGNGNGNGNVHATTHSNGHAEKQSTDPKLEQFLTNLQKVEQEATHKADPAVATANTTQVVEPPATAIDSKQEEPAVDEAAGITFAVDFLDGATLKITGESKRKFEIEFWNPKTNKIIYKTKANSNTVSKTHAKYCFDCQVTVRGESGKVLYKHVFDPEGKRVFIAFESRAMGDTLAWMPYVEEFRQKYNCHVVCMTHFNRLFKNVYPEIEFVPPGTTVPNLYAMYRVGWYINEDAKSPKSAHIRPLQGLGCDILNLTFREQKPKLDFTPGFRPLSKRYVCIATHASTKLKFWNNPDGWQQLVDRLRHQGVEVVAISKEGGLNLQNVITLGELPLESVMNWIHHSEFVIGLSSGLAWLAWALNKHVVMLANFSQEGHEFISGVTRVRKTSVCNGCWNDPEHAFDRNDADWCPRYKNTVRMFECHKAITADDVMDQMKVLLERLKD